MTRINCVNPAELSGKHLVSEYREIVRVFGLVRKAQQKGKNKWSLDIPKEYTLGTGHVRFHYDKLYYVLKRYHNLIKEMIKRGYHPNPVPYKDLVKGIDKSWFKDYNPTEAALMINRERIRERS